MDHLDSMRSALGAFSVYSLDENSAVTKELAVYADLFSRIDSEADEILRELFPETAGHEGLDSYELIVGAVRTDLTLEKRREMVTLMKNITHGGFTVEGVEEFCRSIDFECEIEEHPEFYHLEITPLKQYSAAQQAFIRDRLEAFLPCHLSFTLEFRESYWDAYDALGKTFDEWDALGLDWDHLDRLEAN